VTAHSNRLHRRAFLQGVGATGAGAALAGPFGAFGAGLQEPRPRPRRPRESPAATVPWSPVTDQTTGLPLLLLPDGFEYLSYGWTNDPMTDGTPTPSSHDGMAAFRFGDRVRLVRNHERGAGAPFAAPDRTYDSAAGGGTTNLVFLS
jgi:secreted PhoX family phosphatase